MLGFQHSSGFLSRLMHKDPHMSYWRHDPWIDQRRLSSLFFSPSWDHLSSYMPSEGHYSPQLCPPRWALRPRALPFLVGYFFLTHQYVLRPPADLCRNFRCCEILFFQTWRNGSPGSSVLYSKAHIPPTPSFRRCSSTQCGRTTPAFLF